VNLGPESLRRVRFFFLYPRSKIRDQGSRIRPGYILDEDAMMGRRGYESSIIRRYSAAETRIDVAGEDHRRSRLKELEFASRARSRSLALRLISQASGLVIVIMLIQWLIPFRKQPDRLPQSSKAIEPHRDTKVRTFPARGVTFICQRFAMTEIRLSVRRRSRTILQSPGSGKVGSVDQDTQRELFLRS